MTDTHDRERRGSPRPSGHYSVDEITDVVRLVVREELREAAKDGRFLSDEDRSGVRALLREARTRSERIEKVKDNVAGWASIAAIIWFGAVVWEAIKAKMQQP